MEFPLLFDIVTIFGLSIAVLLICARLKIPSIVGFLFTGIVCGPHGMGMIDAIHEVELMSEVGIVLLLFTIGLEFSLHKLMRIKKLVFIGGGLQVGVTALLIALFTKVGGFSWGQSVFYGFLVSLSSTAITLKVLQDSAKMSTPYGQQILAILIFQDIAVVPMMLLTPFLAGMGGGAATSLLLHLGKGLLILTAVLFAAQKVVPRLLFLIARTRNSQLFILCVLFICFAVAWLTNSIGLSLALGAFLAGLIISESEYSHTAVSHILPFQEVFTSFFFVSIGMLLDVSFLFSHPFQTFFATCFTLLLKFFVAGGVAKLMGYSLRNALVVGLGLCQVGEFAFILSAKGTDVGLIAGTTYQLFLAVSLLTMSVSPFLMALAPKITDFLLSKNLPKWLTAEKAVPQTPKDKEMKDHVVIIGFGVCGRNLAWAAKLSGVPYNILEINPDTVRSEQKNGETIFFGNAAQRAVLEQTDIDKARIAVIAIDDPIASRRIIEVIRSISPKVYILARTRYLNELKPMVDLGADDVIPEEFETSVEIFTRVLKKYLIPQDEIEKFAADVRSKRYQMLRSITENKTTFSDLKLNVADFEIGSFRLVEGSELVGKTLQESNLRNKYGITLLMIQRENRVLSNPAPKTILNLDDLLVAFASPEELVKFSSELKPPEAES